MNFLLELKEASDTIKLGKFEKAILFVSQEIIFGWDRRFQRLRSSKKEKVKATYGFTDPISSIDSKTYNMSTC